MLDRGADFLNRDPLDVPTCTKNESGQPDGVPSTPTHARTSAARPLTDDTLLSRTAATWQPRSQRTLTPEDAREIISNASGFFRVLAEWDRTTSGATPDDEGGS